MTDPTAPVVTPAPAPLDTIENHAKAAKTKLALFAAAKVKMHWAIGSEVTRAAYDAGVDATRNIRCGGIEAEPAKAAK